MNFFLQLHQQKLALEKAVELEKTKNYLENILFSMSDAIFVINQQGRIEICNQGACEALESSQINLPETFEVPYIEPNCASTKVWTTV